MNFLVRISRHASLTMQCTIVARSYFVSFSTLNRVVGILSLIGADSTE